MPHTITELCALDIRTPTSRTLAGSDAMHADPDYSAAYVVLRTDHRDGLAGHGLTFTIGRGNEVCVAAIEALAPLVIGGTLESITADFGAFWRRLTGDTQLRWIGPEKGAIHLATAAVARWIAPFSGPIQRSWLSPVRRRQKPPISAVIDSSVRPTTNGARARAAATHTSLPRPIVNVRP